ncbi:hypothetical protein CPC08DRAFT_824850 [Agrocybe pediades]|nr:hypothetical protein CPC08DRAFT_824850 [Agrocybe pediades]
MPNSETVSESFDLVHESPRQSQAGTPSADKGTSSDRQDPPANFSGEVVEQEILSSVSDVSDEKRRDVLQQYLRTLDRTEAVIGKSTEQPEPETKVASGTDNPKKRSRGSPKPKGSVSKLTDKVNSLEELIQESGGVESSSDNTSTGIGESSDSEKSVDDRGYNFEGRSNKKQRIFENTMPWFKREGRQRLSKHKRSCNETLRLLDIYQRDTATVKRWILTSVTAPSNFPPTEWDAILKGQSVDLDAVLSSLYYVPTPQQNVGVIGSSTIQFGAPKPAKKVVTSGQWTSAYNLLAEATEGVAREGGVCSC